MTALPAVETLSKSESESAFSKERQGDESCKENEGVLLSREKRKTLEEIFREYKHEDLYKSAFVKTQRVLTMYPHIRVAASQEPALKDALVFHQLVAGETRRKFNKNLQSDHDLRVTEALLEYSKTFFGFYPRLETIAASIFHDSMEDYKAKGWVISELFGSTIEGAVKAMTLPKEIKELKNEEMKGISKHKFKMKSIAVFDSGQCAIKHFDNVDVLASFARNILQKQIIVADVPKKVDGKTPILPLSKFKNEILRRHEFSQALNARLEMAHRYHWLNLDGFDCLKMANDFRKQFAKIALVFVEILDIAPHPELQKDLEIVGIKPLNNHAKSNLIKRYNGINPSVI